MKIPEANLLARGPDEWFYLRAAELIRELGPRQGMRELVRFYLESDVAKHMPSPMRWLWLFATAATMRLSPRALQLASVFVCPVLLWWLFGTPWAMFLGVCSPLLGLLGRSYLQDAPVAALTLAAVGCAMHGHMLALGAFLATLLCVKESALLVAPAVVAAGALGGVDLLELALELVASVSIWWGLTILVLGPRASQILHRARTGHDHPYGLMHQRGAPHRLAVDLLLLAPVACIASPMGAEHAPAACAAMVNLVAAHALSPVRNVRTILAAELMVRGLAAVALLHERPIVAAAGLAWCVVADLVIGWRIRNIYDPVTAELTRALRMAP